MTVNLSVQTVRAVCPISTIPGTIAGPMSTPSATTTTTSTWTTTIVASENHAALTAASSCAPVTSEAPISAHGTDHALVGPQIVANLDNSAVAAISSGATAAAPTG